MAHGATLMPLDQLGSVIPSQHTHFLALLLLARKLKILLRNLVLRQQERFPRRAVQQIPEGGVAELDGLSFVLGAENDHVGKIAAVLGELLLVARVLAEDAAGGEDGPDCVDDEARRGEGEVACVVLYIELVLGGGEEGFKRTGAYDSNHSTGSKEGVQVLQELEGEKGDGLGAAGEDVVDDVVVGALG